MYGHVIPEVGTTSACAENTRAPEKYAFACWNYLRVRGEYSYAVIYPQLRKGTTSACAENTFSANFPPPKSAELPPRARRIRRAENRHPLRGGTTSACAENTRRISPRCLARRNYLRVRGEYQSHSLPPGTGWELPPRARRIRRAGVGGGAGFGTTSACAENTHLLLDPLPSPWNYLRVRGEYCSNIGCVCDTMELPPRARRILG